MQIVDCEQGTEEWHLARAGVITASNFQMIRKKVGMLTEQQQKYVDLLMAGNPESVAMEQAGYKNKPSTQKIQDALRGKPIGDFSDAAKNYAFRCAVERISGEPLSVQFQTPAMLRGVEMEEEARLEHEKAIDTIVDLAGFVKSDDGLFGASADSLIGEDGGAEYKCLVDPDRIRTVLLEDDVDEFLPQIQGCMWITGRKWWHYVLYCPALKSVNKHLYVHKVERDDVYIAQMERDLLEFEALVRDYYNQLTEGKKNEQGN